MRFTIIGITDHPHPWFPPEVTDSIRRGHVFSGGRRHHAIVQPLLPKGAQWIDITVPLDAVFQQYHAAGTDIVVFTSGDPLFFGFANTIRRQMPEAELTVYPTFNSLQLLAHRLLLPYHDLRIVSLTGRPWPALDRALIERTPQIGILTDREHTPATIAQRLLEYGYTAYTMHVGEHLGNPGEERVSTLTLSEAAAATFRQPNSIILTGSPDAAPFGLSDDSFALLDGRERMITKMPIRLLTLQMLDLPRRHVLWDIGFCTGSVSIEARLQFPHLRIEAFEVRPECEAIIHANMRHHGAPGISVHMGDFCSVCCDSIAARAIPDAVFIGGHGGRLQAIIEKVLQYLSPQGIIVMNSVSEQSRQLWDEACRTLHLKQEAPLHIAINDYNPITILACKRQEK